MCESAVYCCLLWTAWAYVRLSWGTATCGRALPDMPIATTLTEVNMHMLDWSDHCSSLARSHSSRGPASPTFHRVAHSAMLQLLGILPLPCAVPYHVQIWSRQRPQTLQSSLPTWHTCPSIAPPLQRHRSARVTACKCIAQLCGHMC